ncbi:MAG: hypothetical protein GY715_13865, partial [Planctomycetes bacterium]|nr:hypothetical protein [Planctomycetota bacterium]
GGDAGNDGVLTPGETWTYTCTYDVSGAVDNIAQVIADVVNIPSPSYVEQALYSISALPAPPCDVTGPISACVSQSLMYTGPAGASSYAWQISGDAVIAGPADQQTVTVNVLVGTGFTLTLDTTGTNGCGASCMLAVTIGPTPGCTYFGPSALCVGVTKTYTMTGPGAPSIAWSVDPPSVAVIVGPDDQTTVDVMGVGTGVFDLSVQVISAEGCENVCSADFDVIPLPTCAITPPDPAPACGSTGNQLSAIVFDAPGVIGYTWSVDPESGWSITGGGSTDTVTYSAVSGSATFTLDIVSGGCPSSCQLVVGCAEVAACCLPDETCVEVDAASCADAAGFFRSDGVGCDEAGCPPPGLVTDVQKISETASGFEGMLDADDGFGAAVAEIGDLDNDGVPDLAVGAPGDDDGAIDAGAVWILLMNADGTVKTEQKISATTGGFGGALAAGDGFGSSVAGLGDVNGDGMEDIVVGAPFSNRFFGLNDEGAVYVLFMNEAGTVAGFLEIANLTGGFGGFLDSGANLGSAVESAGDVDGNGVVDLAIGARNGGTGGDGAVWIVLLSPAPEVIGETRITEGESGFVGPLDDPNFGSSVTRLGDMDNNGTEDLLVGAPKDDSNTGELWVLFMTPAGTVLGEQRIAPGVGGLGSGEITSMDLFGAAVASIRDLNGDGVTDVAVGAPGTDGGANVGAVWILFLESDGTVGVQFEIADNVGGFTGGLQPGDAFGSALASVGDLDSDGLRELAVGAPGDDDALGPVTNQGAVWFLQLAGVPQVVLGPPTEFPAFGAGIIHESAVLDTVGVGPGDGGGTNDVVVVIPNADPELNGVVQLFIQTIVVGSGFAGFNEPAPTYTVGRDPTDVALGDYNGDEFTDVAVTNAGDSTVMIFLNDGNGFGTITLHDTVGGVNVPTSIVAGDFIGGDGFPDLAVTNFGNDTVVILSNDGSANFAPADQQAAAIPVGGGPIQMDPIDIDNDKNEDIVTGNFTADSTSVLQNNGNGTFSRQDVSVGDDPFDIAVADFDADGRLDLATANNADGTVTVSRNVTPPLGAPAFDPVLVFNVAVGPVSLDAGDLNDDGFPDLVVIADDQVGGTTVYALTNASQFSSMIAFTLPEAFDALADPNFVATADFDGDGVVDVVTVNNDEGPSGGSVTVFLSVPPVACPADLSGNDAVDFADILSIIAAWGPCSPGDCPQDLDGSGDVGFGDILQVIGSWGSCSGP